MWSETSDNIVYTSLLQETSPVNSNIESNWNMLQRLGEARVKYELAMVMFGYQMSCRTSAASCT